MKKKYIIANLLLVMLCFAIFPFGVYSAISTSTSDVNGSITLSLIPQNYTQVEYIQSSGTEYIVTNYTPNQNTRIITEFALTETGQAAFVYGCRSNSNLRSFTLNMGSSDYFVTSYNAQRHTDIKKQDTVIHTVDKNKNVTLFDDTTLTSDTATFTCPSFLNIFATYDSQNGGNGYLPGKLKLYTLKIWDNDTLVANFVPCKNPSGVAGLYDSVSETFYASAAQGTAFTAGPAI